MVSKKKTQQTHPAEQYVADVLSGKQVAGELVTLACERQVRDLERVAANDPSFPYYFDPKKAQRVIDFAGFCRHFEGKWAGKPIVLEPWQQFSFWVPFGWMRKSDDTRRIRKVYCEVARKNGKSTVTSVLGNYLLVGDKEPGAQVYSAATTRDQAKIIHSAATKMVQASPPLKGHIQVFKNNLTVSRSNSKFEPLSSDFNTLDGLNVHGGLVDEVHAHPNRGVIDVIETAMGARSQPMLWMITTAGVNVQNSIALEFRNYGVSILKGVLKNENYFVLIYTIDPTDQWDDPAVWIKANPNLGVSVNPVQLEEDCQKAREVPSAANNFKTKHLNIWCAQHSMWMPVEKWRANRQDYGVEDLRGMTCYGGIDLSSIHDITALCLVFPYDDYYRTLYYFWVPEENIEARGRRDRVDYPLWAEQGYIHATDGNVIDYGYLRAKLNQLKTLFDIRELAIDRWNATQIVQELQQDGFKMIEFGQGMGSMSAPSKLFENYVLSGKLKHNGSPVMDWMFGNVTVRQDAAGNIRPDKEKSTEKIDGIVASIMGLDRASLAMRSAYETERLMIL